LIKKVYLQKTVAFSEKRLLSTIIHEKRLFMMGLYENRLFKCVDHLKYIDTFIFHVETIDINKQLTARI